MGKKAKTKLCDVLISSGYNRLKVLGFVGYPQCKAIRRVKRSSDPILSELEKLKVRAYTFGSNKFETLMLYKYEVMKFEDLKVPIFDYIQTDEIATIGFRFEDESIVQLEVENQMTIPPAQGWPSLNTA